MAGINVTPSVDPSAVPVATDTVGPDRYQVIKVASGATGAAVLVSAAGGLPVALDTASLAALESITIGTALPTGANVIGTVDLAAPAPTAIVNAATVAAAKYLGITVRETSNTATAVVRVRNSTVAGVILDTITLVANESVSYTYPRGRAAASGTVYVEVVSGAVEGSVFTA